MVNKARSPRRVGRVCNGKGSVTCQETQANANMAPVNMDEQLNKGPSEDVYKCFLILTKLVMISKLCMRLVTEETGRHERVTRVTGAYLCMCCVIPPSPDSLTSLSSFFLCCRLLSTFIIFSTSMCVHTASLCALTAACLMVQLTLSRSTERRPSEQPPPPRLALSRPTGC